MPIIKILFWGEKAEKQRQCINFENEFVHQLEWPRSIQQKTKPKKDGYFLPIIKILLWGGGGRIAGQCINVDNNFFSTIEAATMEAARLT